MIYSHDRRQVRSFFIEVWSKYRARQPLEPLEAIIAEVICAHPEYHFLLEDNELALESDFPVELEQSNPFLHMGLHIALKEQLASNRPAGIAAIYQALVGRLDPQEAEHRMVECLGETLWHAQRSGEEPDEGAYLECLHKLTR